MSLNQLHKIVLTPNQIAKQQSFQIENNKEKKKTYKSQLRCEINFS